MFIRTTLVVVCITLLTGSVSTAVAGGSGDDASSVPAWYYPEKLVGYALLTMSYRDDAPWSECYYIVRPTTGHDYIILDTIQVYEVTAGDTNALVYVDIGEQFTYLVAVMLSPHVTHDTLLSIRNTATDNWLQKMDGFGCSLRDSLVVYVPSGQPYPSVTGFEVIVMRADAEGTWRQSRTFGHVISYEIVRDFSEVLFSFDPTAKPSSATAPLKVLDIATDSVYVLCELDQPARYIERHSRASPVYFLMDHSGVRNLWSYSTAGGLKPLTEYRLPWSVKSFELRSDALWLRVDSARVRGLFRTIMLDKR